MNYQTAHCHNSPNTSDWCDSKGEGGFMGHTCIQEDFPAQKTPAEDMVHHPKHYTSHPSGVECITIIQWFPSNIAAAMKYLWRCGLKTSADPIQDLEKAKRYIDFEIKRLQNFKITEIVKGSR